LGDAAEAGAKANAEALNNVKKNIFKAFQQSQLNLFFRNSEIPAELRDNAIIAQWFLCIAASPAVGDKNICQVSPKFPREPCHEIAFNNPNIVR
jgi:hypothetical protein